MIDRDAAVNPAAGLDCASTAPSPANSTEQRIRRLRLATAMVLLSYVFGHFINHGLGVVSLEAMRVWLDGMMWLWRNPLGGGLLYLSLLTHALLGLWSLYSRSHLRMPPWEAVQLATGLLIPPLLLGHAVATRLAYELYSLDVGYPKVLTALWVNSPENGIRQLVLMGVVWLHASIGLHYWLRLKPWYRGAQPWLLGTALLVPVLALLGYIEAGRDIAILARSADWIAQLQALYGRPLPEQAARLQATVQVGHWLMASLLALTLAARLLRQAWARRHGLVTISYPGGRRVAVVPGTSVLEASRGAGIGHASVCGGRGRCSTCRIRIGQGLDRLPPPDDNEARVLNRIKAPPNVRLACQTRPQHDLEAVPLLPAGTESLDSVDAPAYVQGVEREVAILFVDLRASTQLIEDKLPYDVVFILNRFFAATTAGMERAGGHFAQFAGDGMMGLFGAAEGATGGARAALAAVRYMHENLDELNKDLTGELQSPLRMGIGLHVGLAIVGAMGNPRSPIVTAIGDAVNVAARLEGLCKTFDCEAVVSSEVMRLAGVDGSAFPLQRVQVRGRNELLEVHPILDALMLPPLAAAAR